MGAVALDTSLARIMYIRSKKSLSDLAKELNISIQTLENRSVEENWVKAREDYISTVYNEALEAQRKKDVKRVASQLVATDDILDLAIKSVKGLDKKGNEKVDADGNVIERKFSVNDISKLVDVQRKLLSSVGENLDRNYRLDKPIGELTDEELENILLQQKAKGKIIEPDYSIQDSDKSPTIDKEKDIEEEHTSKTESTTIDKSKDSTKKTLLDLGGCYNGS